eukprot:TRINITY_DN8519_c0_g1_i1.p1 TRINITY_DN8519_c0_g1~~TRINITY_DN8519_c0_g1_i1.p1  ORF type:complete len:1374 (-),score=207.40 TRINITY_DN8519_c0_g1_i1:269-4390(-)
MAADGPDSGHTAAQLRSYGRGLADGSGRKVADTIEDKALPGPSSRLACLELYVYLLGEGYGDAGVPAPSGPASAVVGPASGSAVAGSAPPLAAAVAPSDGDGGARRSGGGGSFCTEEDKRGRVLLRWRADRAAATGFPGAEHVHGRPRAHGLAEQTWQVSYALSAQDDQKRSPQPPGAALYDTLGLEAISWLWDGISGLVLSAGPTREFAANPGFDLFAGSSQGLLGRCFEEICCRAQADPDPERFCLGLSLWEIIGEHSEDLLAAPGEDASRELRFETVRFQSAEEALALLSAAQANRNDIMEDAACDAAANEPQSLSVARRGQSLADAAPRRAARHTFLRVVVFDAHRETLAALHFAQIARSAIADDVTKSTLATDNRALWNLLEAASAGEALNSPCSDEPCRLSAVLGPLLNGNCKSFLLCAVPEKPENSEDAEATHAMLDVAERASLITAQCGSVVGVRRDDFQLASYVTAMQRLRLRVGRTFEPPCLDTAVLAAETLASAIAPSRSQEDWGRRRFGGNGRELPEPAAEPPAAVVVSGGASPSSPSTLGRGAPSSPAARRPSTNTHSCSQPVEPLSLADASAADVLLNSGTDSSRAGAITASTTLPPGSAVGASARLESGYAVGEFDVSCNSFAREAVVARDMCLEECRELGAACAALRACNEAKALRRKRELQQVWAEVDILRDEVERYEDACEAPDLIRSLRAEVKSLRDEASRVRELNAALAGARGEEQVRAARRTALQALQEDARELRRSAADVEQGEKRANMVHRCLDEVGSRLEMSKQKLAESQRDYEALQPTVKELERRIEEIEKHKRSNQDELDKLRRTSSGLRAEVQQLREVRGAIDALPPAHLQGGRTAALEPHAVCSKGSEGAFTNGGGAGTDHFAVLERRLAAVAPQLVPAASRARAEMEELTRCCLRLEERQRRLEKVVPVAEVVNGSFGVGGCEGGGGGVSSVGYPCHNSSVGSAYAVSGDLRARARSSSVDRSVSRMGVAVPSIAPSTSSGHITPRRTRSTDRYGSNAHRAYPSEVESFGAHRVEEVQPSGALNEHQEELPSSSRHTYGTLHTPAAATPRGGNIGRAVASNATPRLQSESLGVPSGQRDSSLERRPMQSSSRNRLSMPSGDSIDVGRKGNPRRPTPGGGGGTARGKGQYGRGFSEERPQSARGYGQVGVAATSAGVNGNMVDGHAVPGRQVVRGSGCGYGVRGANTALNDLGLRAPDPDAAGSLDARSAGACGTPVACATPGMNFSTPVFARDVARGAPSPASAVSVASARAASRERLGMTTSRRSAGPVQPPSSSAGRQASAPMELALGRDTYATVLDALSRPLTSSGSRASTVHGAAGLAAAAMTPAAGLRSTQRQQLGPQR